MATEWIGIVATVIGGAITLVTTYLVQMSTGKREAQARREARVSELQDRQSTEEKEERNRRHDLVRETAAARDAAYGDFLMALQPCIRILETIVYQGPQKRQFVREDRADVLTLLTGTEWEQIEKSKEFADFDLALTKVELVGNDDVWPYATEMRKVFNSVFAKHGENPEGALEKLASLKAGMLNGIHKEQAER